MGDGCTKYISGWTGLQIIGMRWQRQWRTVTDVEASSSQWSLTWRLDVDTRGANTFIVWREKSKIQTE